MKYIKIMFFGLLIAIITVAPVFAYSPNWYHKDGHWRIKDSNGNDIVNRNIKDDNGVYLNRC